MKGELQRVMLVEDDDAIRMVAKMSLELGGMAVCECASGPEALLAAPQAAVDMIMLDVMMPGMNGLETFDRLREIPACADMPIVFLTARVMAANIGEYKAKGAVACIMKPFDSATLPDQLRAIFAAVPEK